MGIRLVVAAADVPIMVSKVEISNILIRISRVSHNDLTGIVPVVQIKTEHVVHSTAEISPLIEISKVLGNGLARRRVREIDNAGRTRIRRTEDSRSISMETREELVNGSHLIGIRRMGLAVTASGATSHVVQTNITIKNRSKIWMTCSRRSRRS